MSTAQEFLEAAYNRSAANDPGKLAQDAELLGHLHRVFQRFFMLFAKARPDEAGSQSTLTLASNPPYVALPADTITILSIEDALGAQVHLIPASERMKLWHMAPSVYQIGNTLYSRARGGDPLAGAVLTMLWLDPPAALTTLASVIDVRFPTRHHQVCIDALALYLDTKDDGRNPTEHAKLASEYQTALGAFASEYDLPPSALEWAHGPAKRSPAVGGKGG